MYTLVQSIPFRELLLRQAPALFVSLVIAEIFFKFHSFTLECIAFLVTWYAIDAVVELIRSAWRTRSE
jgi:hypothetical protein